MKRNRELKTSSIFNCQQLLVVILVIVATVTAVGTHGRLLLALR